ncbi:MAG: DUF5777 family beta-barrel protein [Chitinophagaceae bacterium]
MKRILLLMCTIWFTPALFAQDLSQIVNDSMPKPSHVPVIATFKSDEIVNGQSNETWHKHDFVFNISHRFGDFAGTNGGIKRMYGFDYATDVLISFDYGISDRLSWGLGRARGGGVQQELWYTNLKYRLLQQTTDDYIPIAITLFGNAVVSTMTPSLAPNSDAAFQNFSQRWSFVTQAIFARKFNEQFSLALLPTYIRRNLVAPGDLNDMFAMGIGGRLKITQHSAIVVDYFVPFRSQQSRDAYTQLTGGKYYNSLGIGWEIETGGHVFHINFTNSTAILENQFIPQTTTTWTKGQFRWGFNISRTFSLFAPKHKH